VINVAGHRIGTREIEEAVQSHANIAEVAANDLFILHYDLGKFIRQEAGLWRDNVPLLIDCQRIKEGSAPDQPTINPDDASMVIIEALWRRLRDQ